MIKFKHYGDFSKSNNFLKRAFKQNPRSILARYAQQGVNALALSTPKDSGETARAWTYEISTISTGYKINWFNNNIVDNAIIAILLQYGHGTRNGGYVKGRDYINPAIRPIFDKIAEEAWMEVTR